MIRLVPFLFLLFIVQSCSMEKRLYRNGYYRDRTHHTTRSDNAGNEPTSALTAKSLPSHPDTTQIIAADSVEKHSVTETPSATSDSTSARTNNFPSVVINQETVESPDPLYYEPRDLKFALIGLGVAVLGGVAMIAGMNVLTTLTYSTMWGLAFALLGIVLTFVVLSILAKHKMKRMHRENGDTPTSREVKASEWASLINVIAILAALTAMVGPWVIYSLGL